MTCCSNTKIHIYIYISNPKGTFCISRITSRTILTSTCFVVNEAHVPHSSLYMLIFPLHAKWMEIDGICTVITEVNMGYKCKSGTDFTLLLLCSTAWMHSDLVPNISGHYVRFDLRASVLPYWCQIVCITNIAYCLLCLNFYIFMVCIDFE